MKNNKSKNLKQLILPFKGHSFGSLFFKYLSFLSLLIVAPMLLMACIVAVSYHKFAEKEITLYSNQTVSLIQNSMEEMIEYCLQQSNDLLSDNDIYLYLVTPAENEYTFYRNDVIYKTLNTQLKARDYLESVYIYSAVNHKMVSNYGEIKLENFFDVGWYDFYKEQEGDSTFYYQLREGENRFLQPVKTLTLYRELIQGNERKGVILYNINFDIFSQELSKLRNKHDIGLNLRNIDDKLNLNVWGDENTTDQLKITENSDSGYFRTKNAILFKTPINNTDLFLYSTLSYNAIQESLHGLLRTMIWIVVAGLLLVIGLTLLISVRLYRPFQRILDELTTPANIMAGRVTISGSEEEFILNTIRGVFKENVEITDELSHRVALLKQAQSVALQSQINPHFLHNTLDSINWTTMRLTGGKNEASIMLSKLAQMLRYSLDNVDTLVTLDKELENTLLYIELQSIRYENSFKVEWDIEESARNCQVIKLMLQPLVENAIQHGLKPIQDEGFLRISVHIIDSILTIEVYDNGTGIPPERLDELQRKLNSDMIQEKNSIGIINVHQRIQLFYGKEFGISFDTNNGTLIKLRMPQIISN